MLVEAKEVIEKFYQNHPHWVVVIRGATATWKTWLSLALSDFFDLEVISSDSRQVFCSMNIGTDKIPGRLATDDISALMLEKWLTYPYLTQERGVPHWLIDIVPPDSNYTAWEWKEDTLKLVPSMIARSKKPFIVWGTWLYIDTIYKNFLMPDSKTDLPFRKSLEKLEFNNPWILHKKLQIIDPQEADRLHPNSTRYIIRALEIYEHTGHPKSFFNQKRKPEWPLLLLWLWRDKASTNRRINKRIKEMLAWWLVAEVQWLLDTWFDHKLQSMQWIGYKQVVDYLTDHHSLDRLEEDLKRSTHRLAKKQRSWFRRYIADAHINEYPGYVYHHVITLEDS